MSLKPKSGIPSRFEEFEARLASDFGMSVERWRKLADATNRRPSGSASAMALSTPSVQDFESLYCNAKTPAERKALVHSNRDAAHALLRGRKGAPVSSCSRPPDRNGNGGKNAKPLNRRG